MLKNVWSHLFVILHHKWEVFKLCTKLGMPIRGILHDLSKFSPTEFIQSVTYYAGGVMSPITLEKRDLGYSKAWLHHKGRNKHHPEYWYDNAAPVSTPIMPFPYVCEMICDQLSAGIVYQGKNWTKEYQLSYWNNKQKSVFPLHDALKNMLEETYTQVAKKGVKEVITRQNLKKLYDTYTKEEIETSSQKN